MISKARLIRMNKYDVRRLQKQLKAMKKANDPIYLQLKDCAYKVIGAGTLEEVESIPDGAKIEIVDCLKKDFVWLFQVNGKCYWTEIISVSEAIRRGELEDNGWTERNNK